MPKKSGLMNERERGICSRLKELREYLKYSQPAFAAEIGLTLDQLASIEYARNPLRFGVGNWICGRFDVNQRWMAEGNLPMFFCLFPSPRILNLISPQAMFSEAYDKCFKLWADDELLSVAKSLKCRVEDIKAEDAHNQRAGELSNLSLETFQIILSRAVRELARGIHSNWFPLYYQALYTADRNFKNEYKKSGNDVTIPMQDSIDARLKVEMEKAGLAAKKKRGRGD